MCLTISHISDLMRSNHLIIDHANDELAVTSGIVAAQPKHTYYDMV